MKIAGDLRCVEGTQTRRLKLVGQRCTAQLLDCLLQVTLTQRYRLEPDQQESDLEAETAAATTTTDAAVNTCARNESTVDEEGLQQQQEQELGHPDDAIPDHSNSENGEGCASTAETSDSKDGQHERGRNDHPASYAPESSHPVADTDECPQQQIPADAKDSNNDSSLPVEPVHVVYWLAVNTEEAVLTAFESQSDDFHIKREVVGAADLAKSTLAAHRQRLKAGSRTGAVLGKTSRAQSKTKLQLKSSADLEQVSDPSARAFIQQLKLADDDAESLSDVVCRCYRIRLGKAWPWRDVEVSVTYTTIAGVVKDWIEIRLPTKVYDLTRYNPHRPRLRSTPRTKDSAISQTGETVVSQHTPVTGKSAESIGGSNTSTISTSSKNEPKPAENRQAHLETGEDTGISGAADADDGERKPKLKRFRSGVEYGICLSVKAIVPGEVTSLLSPSHGQSVSVRTYGSDAHRAAVEYGPVVDDLPPRDIDLKVQHTRNRRPCVTLLEKPAGCGVGAAAMLSIAAPDFTHLRTAQPGSGGKVGEFIFMVDQSGSMSTTFSTAATQSGRRLSRGGAAVACSFMDQAKSTLMLFLHSLPPCCFFNIIGFGSRRLRLFKKSESYDDDALKEARKHVGGLTNNLGGTDLLRPLAEVLDAQPAMAGVPRCVFVLTDGAVGSDDTAEVFRKVRHHARSTRIFSLGIGTSAGRHLVRGLARFGNGLYSFITSPTQDMTQVVMKQLKEAVRPPLMAPTIDWGDLSVDYQYPSADNLVPVCPGRPYTVFAVLKPSSSRQCTVKLRGTTCGERLDEEVAVRPTQTDSRNKWKLLHQFAAAAHLVERQQLADDKFVATSRLARTKLMATESESMALISIQYQVFSPATSELLLDLSPAADASGGAVPAREKLLGARVMEHVHLQPSTDRASDPLAAAPSKRVLASRKSSDQANRVSTPTLSGLASASTPELSLSDQAVDPAQRLTKLQQASGMWTTGVVQVAALLFLDPRGLAGGNGCETYARLQRMGTLSSDDLAAVWTTLVVLSFLRTHCPGQTETLLMITDKAKAAVANVLVARSSFDVFVQGLSFVDSQLDFVAQALKRPKPELRLA